MYPTFDSHRLTETIGTKCEENHGEKTRTWAEMRGHSPMQSPMLAAVLGLNCINMTPPTNAY